MIKKPIRYGVCHMKKATDEIDKNGLVDIRNVDIDPAEPIERRMKKYLQQIKNPYRFLIGDIVVNIGFAEGGKTLDEVFPNHLNT